MSVTWHKMADRKSYDDIRESQAKNINIFIENIKYLFQAF